MKTIEAVATTSGSREAVRALLEHAPRWAEWGSWSSMPLVERVVQNLVDRSDDSKRNREPGSPDCSKRGRSCCDDGDFDNAPHGRWNLDDGIALGPEDAQTAATISAAIGVVPRGNRL